MIVVVFGIFFVSQAEEHDGNEPDRVTFSKMTHTRGPKQLPVDDESAKMMVICTFSLDQIYFQQPLMKFNAFTND